MASSNEWALQLAPEKMCRAWWRPGLSSRAVTCGLGGVVSSSTCLSLAGSLGDRIDYVR